MMCFDEWNSCVLSNCGHYYSTPVKNMREQSGDFRIKRKHGVEIAELSCQIDRIDRARAGIRRDEQEFLFLLLQRFGSTGVVHSGREETLQPGDGLLLDSTRTAELRFDGNPSSFVSVHLPRSLFMKGRHGSLIMGQRVLRANPMHASLQKMLSDEDDTEIDADFLFDFIALMFRSKNPESDAMAFRDQVGRYRFVREMIDRHMSESEFSIEQLAGLVHMSRRQLQRDFHSNGTTFTRHLVERRVKSVAAQLRHAAQHGHKPRISELAFGAGFNDLSYFNREFRKRYELSPGNYLASLGDAPGCETA